jgi:hypothetical protein
MIGESQGKIIGTRVLPCEGQNPVLEVSFQAAGKMLGVEATDLGTYQSVLTPAGVFRGKGQGISMTKDGDTLTWTGEGVGTPKGKGQAASWRGSLFYQTTSQRYAQFNKITVLFEFEVDEQGNTRAKIWEWK